MRTGFFGLFLLLATFSKAQSGDAALNKGNDYYRQGQFSLAENQYKAVLQKTPDNSTAQYNLANALYQQKKWAEAHGVLKKLNDMVTEKNLKAAVYYNNGVVYTKETDLGESIEAYKDALRLKPDDTEARENLQKALTEQKKQEQQKEQEQKKQQKSSMSQKEAEQKLKLLQEREKKLQERLQQSGQKGNSMPNDW